MDFGEWKLRRGPSFKVSAMHGKGLPELVREMRILVQGMRDREASDFDAAP